MQKQMDAEVFTCRITKIFVLFGLLFEKLCVNVFCLIIQPKTSSDMLAATSVSRLVIRMQRWNRQA
jgi:hypothetical protein